MTRLKVSLTCLKISKVSTEVVEKETNLTFQTTSAPIQTTGVSRGESLKLCSAMAARTITKILTYLEVKFLKREFMGSNGKEIDCLRKLKNEDAWLIINRDLGRTGISLKGSWRRMEWYLVEMNTTSHSEHSRTLLGISNSHSLVSLMIWLEAGTVSRELNMKATTSQTWGIIVSLAHCTRGKLTNREGNARKVRSTSTVTLVVNTIQNLTVSQPKAK